MWAVSKSAVEAVLHAMPSGVRLVDAGACLVVAEVVLALGVTGGAVQVGAAGERRHTAVTSKANTNM